LQAICPLIDELDKKRFDDELNARPKLPVKAVTDKCILAGTSYSVVLGLRMAQYGYTGAATSKAGHDKNITNPFYYKRLKGSMSSTIGILGGASIFMALISSFGGGFFAILAIIFSGVCTLAFFMAAILQLERIASAIEKTNSEVSSKLNIED